MCVKYKYFLVKILLWHSSCRCYRIYVVHTKGDALIAISTAHRSCHAKSIKKSFLLNIAFLDYSNINQLCLSPQHAVKYNGAYNGLRPPPPLA